MTPDHLSRMAADGTLIPAVERLLHAVNQKQLYGVIYDAMKAFEPSPLDQAREALRKCGYMVIPGTQAIEGDAILFREHHPNEHWRLGGQP